MCHSARKLRLDYQWFQYGLNRYFFTQLARSWPPLENQPLLFCANDDQISPLKFTAQRDAGSNAIVGIDGGSPVLVQPSAEGNQAYGVIMPISAD